MPALKNGRHELFAQAIAQNIPAKDAYVQAGYAYNEGNASRLKGTKQIQDRVAELMQRAARRVEVTLEKLFRDLEEIRERAVAGKQYSAAVAALREMAVLAQLRVEKVANTHRFEDADKISDAELLRIAMGSDDEPKANTEAGAATQH